MDIGKTFHGLKYLCCILCTFYNVPTAKNIIEIEFVFHKKTKKLCYNFILR